MKEIKKISIFVKNNNFIMKLCMFSLVSSITALLVISCTFDSSLEMQRDIAELKKVVLVVDGQDVEINFDSPSNAVTKVLPVNVSLPTTANVKTIETSSNTKVNITVSENIKLTSSLIVKIALENSSKSISYEVLFIEDHISNYVVTFNSLGGTEIPNQEVHANLAIEPMAPKRLGYVFKGWETSRELTEDFDFSLVITEDVTLFAKWEFLLEYRVIEDEFRNIVAVSGIKSAYENLPDLDILIPSKTEADFEVYFVDEKVFQNKTNIRSVTIEEGLREIKVKAFYNCTNLQRINFPSTLLIIGESAFENTGLTAISLPKNMIDVAFRAFKNCASLTAIGEIPKGIKDISYEVFSNCDISTLSIDSNIERIANASFAGNSNLIITFIRMSSNLEIESGPFGNILISSGLWSVVRKIRIPAVSYNQYLSHPKWSDYITIMESYTP